MWTRHILQELAEYSDTIPTLDVSQRHWEHCNKKKTKNRGFLRWSGALKCSVWMGIPSDLNDSARESRPLAPDRNSATFPWHSWAVASAVRAWTWKKIGRKKKRHNGMPQSLSRIGLTERLRIEILTNQASDSTNLTLHQLSNYWLKLKKTLLTAADRCCRKTSEHPTDGSLWPHVPGNRQHPRTTLPLGQVVCAQFMAMLWLATDWLLLKQKEHRNTPRNLDHLGIFGNGSKLFHVVNPIINHPQNIPKS